MKKELHFLEKNLYLSLVPLILMVALGFIVTRIDGGLLGEEKIYGLLGGQTRNPLLLSIMKFLDWFGSEPFLVPAISFYFIYGLIKKKNHLSFGLLSASLGAFLLNTAFKFFFNRPRPEAFMLIQEASSSFPSGHTMTNTCLYLFITYYLSNYGYVKNKKLAYSLALLGALVMGFSRIYLGVHYISDIVGGLLGGYVAFLLSVYVSEKTYKNLKNKTN